MTEAAEADLAGIWAYLAGAAPEAIATRLIRGLEAALAPLRRFPLTGPAPGLRVTFHGAYAVYYRPLADAVVVVRVLHGARDAGAIAEDGGFDG